MKHSRVRLLVSVAAAGATVVAAAQGRKPGGPEDNLPSNITQLTAFGERASWSPDGQQIAFPGYKASNPVVSPDGRTIAFQSARSTDEAGVGYGIFLLTVR
jgi:hypothetical protein